MAADAPEPSAPKAGRRRLVLRTALVAAISTVVLAVVGLLGAASWYQDQVVSNPGAHIERSHIFSVIAQESPVYYRDGTTRIGVFFDDEHRQYVSYDDMPPAFVIAIVAAEDGAFWSHAGVDPWGIARAMVSNLQAGRTVAGGSTLTQQTAKNLYYRPDRSLRAKGEELVNALRLEAHYDKTEILSFYANQFHVSGNGRGLGIAARYFFDKDVSELAVVESAFIAGLVKGPGNYDPFLGSEERRASRRERAHERTRYVLRRILAEQAEALAGPLPDDDDAAYLTRLAGARGVQEEARLLLDEGFELPFRRGVFRYDSSAVLDEVRLRLSDPPFTQVLADAGIDDADKAGLVVITTLDPDAQREAIYGLWHHLTEVGTWLEAIRASDYIRSDSRGPRFDPQQALVAHTFRRARVAAHVEQEGKAVLDVDMGGQPCRVDRDALVRVAVAIERGRKKQRKAKASTAQVDALAKAMTRDSVVWVSVRELPDDGPALCDLEVRPELQGASVVLQDGQFRAMVGGNDNRNFNRATALRQMGSTWKPLVFHAAMELGWSPTDALDNRRNVFPFSTTYYYPRPDHEPHHTVSLAWAGVNSENLASIWLLYHLTDKLNGEQVRVLAKALGLARDEGEGSKDYRRRIQKAGVLPTRSRVVEGLFLQSRQDALGSLAFSGHPEDALALQSMLYGWGYASERDRVAREGSRARVRKTRSLGNSWLSLEARRAPCRDQHRALVKAVERGEAPTPESTSDLSVLVDGEAVKVACGAMPEGYVPVNDESIAALLPHPLVLPQLGSEGTLSDALLDVFSAPLTAVDGPILADVGDLRVDDWLHLSTLDAVASSLRRRQLTRATLGDEAPDLYDADVLYWHQDFRVLLALRYVAELARQYGVQSEVPPVLSLPLGATEITLEEATTVYSGLVTGSRWHFPGEGAEGAVDAPPSPALLIAEIRDVNGTVLYQAAPEPHQVTSDGAGRMTADILRNVVRFGTGRRALYAVKAGDKLVPLGGKTGTTNDYKNAAFLGYVPQVGDAGYEASGGFIVGTYVGYDDNRPMTSGGIRLAGSSGALPAWIGAAKGLQEAGLLGEPNLSTDQSFWPTATVPYLHAVRVNGETGLPLTGDVPVDVWGEPLVPGSLEPTALVQRPDPRRRLALEVAFDEVPAAVRVAPRTEDAKQLEAARRRKVEELLDQPTIWNDY